MSRTQPSLLRTAAEQSLARTFCDLTPSKLDELAVSMVRQWTSCNGTAVVMTPTHDLWFTMKREPGRSIDVRLGITPSTPVERMRESRIAEEDIPAVLDELNIRQTARCHADYGQALLLRVDPAQRSFHITFDGMQQWKA